MKQRFKQVARIMGMQRSRAAKCPQCGFIDEKAGAK
jgi:hypothetical protein